MIKCQKCGKNPATVHLTEIANGEKHENHLCETCAAEQGIATGKTAVSMDWLAKFVMEQSASAAVEPGGPVCDSCGLSFNEFRQRGLLGCAKCYAAFEPMLMPLIRRAHGNADRHVGKIPPTADRSQRRQYLLVDLRRRLRQAVDAEQYEVAAELRDRIQQLENG